jgi:hypothetical protein
MKKEADKEAPLLIKRGRLSKSKQNHITKFCNIIPKTKVAIYIAALGAPILERKDIFEIHK